MIVHDVQQRSPEWHALRLGRLCASDAGDMLATIKSGEAAARRDLRLRLVVERLTGRSSEDTFVSSAMQRGVDCEAAARLAYETRTGHLVNEVGFVSHGELMAGASPDGEIDGFKTLVEIKAPKSSTHLGYLKSGKVPSGYMAQIVHQMWITGASAVDFFSWDDRFQEGLQTFLVRVPRDQAQIDAYELMVRAFLREIEKECAEVDALAGAAA